MKLQSTLYIAITFIIGCFISLNLPAQSQATRDVKTETRALATFNSLKIAGSYKVTVTVGQSQAVNVSGTPTAISNVITEVKDNTLYIHAPANLMSETSANIAINLPELQNLNMSGANTINVSQLNGDKLKVLTTGKQEIELSGQVNNFDVELMGANNFDSQKLLAQNVNLKATGFSQIKIFAAKEFHVQTAGNVDVLLFGNPKKVTTSMFGGGQLKVSE